MRKNDLVIFKLDRKDVQPEDIHNLKDFDKGMVLARVTKTKDLICEVSGFRIEHKNKAFAIKTTIDKSRCTVVNGHKVLVKRYRELSSKKNKATLLALKC